jgi:hypothetical protein
VEGDEVSIADMNDQGANAIAGKTTPQGCMDERAGAAFFGIKPATMRKWRRLGIGPRYLKFGRLVRYDLRDLEAFKAASARP